MTTAYIVPTYHAPTGRWNWIITVNDSSGSQPRVAAVSNGAGWATEREANGDARAVWRALLRGANRKV